MNSEILYQIHSKLQALNGTKDENQQNLEKFLVKFLLPALYDSDRVSIPLWKIYHEWGMTCGYLRDVLHHCKLKVKLDDMEKDVYKTKYIHISVGD